MISVLYEDGDIIVVHKPAGVESQAAKGFQPDMVSAIRNYWKGQQRQELSTKLSTKSPKMWISSSPAYVGVVHRLDKPVEGVMVYAKNQKSAAALTSELAQGNMKKIYQAVVCGKPVDNQGVYVDYLLKRGRENKSEVVDKSTEGSKEARLSFRVLGTAKAGELLPETLRQDLSLLEIVLITGRHHQIRVQMASHGTPVWGDRLYGGCADLDMEKDFERQPLALCACKLTFVHPITRKKLTFQVKPSGRVFHIFEDMDYF